MKTPTKIRLVTFSLAFLVLLGGFWLDTRLSLSASSTQLEYVYRRALGDLTGYVTGMQSTLEKARYAGAPTTQTEISAQLLEQSGGAKAAMAALPLSQEKAEAISRFLSRVGDYALCVSRKSFSEEGLEKSDLEGLSLLQDYAGRLTGALQEVQSGLTAEGKSLVKIESRLNNLEGLEVLASLDDSMDEAAQEFATFPTLLYDGPFSDHIARRRPLFIENAEGVTQEAAAQKAADFLGCGTDALTCTGQGSGPLAAYGFSWEGSMVSVTRQGGQVCYYKKDGQVKSPRLNYPQALEAAKDFLSQAGFPPLTESYYVTSDGLCTINFHTIDITENGQQALCYPDLVKVTVELEQGGAVELDCTGFLMNCHRRTLKSPRIRQEEAQQTLSPLLEVEKAGLAVIPGPGLEELLCWEFLCTAADGREILSYVNTETGLEEQLYLLQKDGHGVLTV